MSRPWRVQAVQSPKDGKWRTRLYGGNGEIVMSGEAYARRAAADRAAQKIASTVIVYKEPRP